MTRSNPAPVTTYLEIIEDHLNSLSTELYMLDWQMVQAEDANDLERITSLEIEIDKLLVRTLELREIWTRTEEQGYLSEYDRYSISDDEYGT